MKVNTMLMLLLLGWQPFVFAADVDDLFASAIFGKHERLTAILSQGVNVNEKTKAGRTALMGASFNGNIRVVRILLAYGADVNIADNAGSTALMDAVSFGYEQLVELLITAGANVNAVDKQAISVLDKAQKTPYKNIIKMLQNAGAKGKKTKDSPDPSLPVETEQPVANDDKTTATTQTTETSTAE